MGSSCTSLLFNEIEQGGSGGVQFSDSDRKSESWESLRQRQPHGWNRHAGLHVLHWKSMVRDAEENRVSAYQVLASRVCCQPGCVCNSSSGVSRLYVASQSVIL